MRSCYDSKRQKVPLVFKTISLIEKVSREPKVNVETPAADEVNI